MLASEIDPAPARVYEANWGLAPAGDIRELAADPERLMPEHAVLAGGFPCQPFSKSGMQRGMSELRGQMFNEILKILDVRKPPVVVLENVRNIAGPRQRPVWDAIIHGLRDAGYRVSSEPCVYSPHLLSPQEGGSPQTRDRVYILGVYVGRDRAHAETDVVPVVRRVPSEGWRPQDWSLEDHVLQTEQEITGRSNYLPSNEELMWIESWNDFLARMGDAPLPGFPMWSQLWHDAAAPDAGAPDWKQRFQRQNIDFYRQHRRAISGWLRANPHVRSFPASRQKLEWQAGDSARDLRVCLLQFRPSGIRAKKPNYAPALVAMGQTPVIGPRMRRLTTREAARLQGFPDWFDFLDQRHALTYKQLGNAVHPGMTYYLLRTFILENAEELITQAGGTGLVEAVRAAPPACMVPQPHPEGASAPLPGRVGQDPHQLVKASR